MDTNYCATHASVVVDVAKLRKKAAAPMYSPSALYHHLLKLKKEYRLVVHRGRHIVVAAQAQNLVAQSLQDDGIMTHIPQPPLQILRFFACDRAKHIRRIY